MEHPETRPFLRHLGLTKLSYNNFFKRKTFRKIQIF